MRRQFVALSFALLLVFAGCQAFDTSSSPGETPTGTPDERGSPDAEATPSNTTPGGSAAIVAPPDPSTDRLGWENGYWHNETVTVTSADGFNESERAAVVNRAMARVEYVRQLEFDRTVPVELVSRETYRSDSSSDYGETLRRFDNAKFEALFLVGEERGSIEVQQSNLGSSVLGYYSPSREAIVLVSDSETPTISEGTLGHELVHALQDQQFGLDSSARTRDAVQGRNGLIEGDASATEDAYMARCGQAWRCLTDSAGGGGGGGDTHYGIYLLQYFPYSDGPSFVSALRARGGWDAVDDAYDETPDGAREIIAPDDYDEWEPRNLTLPDRSGPQWQRLRPSVDSQRPDYAVVGPSAIAAGMMYTMYDDYDERRVVTPQQVFNYNSPGTINSTDPYNYDLDGTRGWDGGRMEIYTNGSETGYVWRTTWTDNAAATTFAQQWTRLIAHWGGTETADGNWVIADDSPFTDAIGISVEDDTVTVVNAPTEAQLSDVYDA